jgi:hypothetical protein
MNIKQIRKIENELKMSKKINVNDETKDIKKKNKDYTEKITNSDDDDYDEENNNEQRQEYEFMDEFKALIKTYIEDDDKRREYQSIIKSISAKQKKMSDEIRTHLERMGRTSLNLGGKSGGKLIINKYVSKGTLNNDIVENVLREEFRDPKIIDSVLTKIEDKKNENVKTRIQLKRTFERKKN